MYFSTLHVIFPITHRFFKRPLCAVRFGFHCRPKHQFSSNFKLSFSSLTFPSPSSSLLIFLHLPLFISLHSPLFPLFSRSPVSLTYSLCFLFLLFASKGRQSNHFYSTRVLYCSPLPSISILILKSLLPVQTFLSLSPCLIVLVRSSQQQSLPSTIVRT